MKRTMENVLALGVALAVAGCGTDDATVVGGDPGGGAAGTSAAPGPEPSEPPPCVENPVTHLDLINACTSAVKVRKTPSLTLLNPDGTLPPL